MRAALAILVLAAPAIADDHVFTPADVFNLEYATNPAISPDGSLVVYQRVGGDIMSDRFRSSLWAIDLDAGTHRPIVQGDGSYTNPVWSPAGDRLLYSASEDGDSSLRVFFPDTRDSATIAELRSGASNAAWSPDGSTIAFGMFVPAVGDSGAVPPAPLPDKPEGADWAPPVTVVEDVQYRFDGRGYLERGATHLFTLPADGGTPRQITSGRHDHAGPYAWAGAGAIVLSANPVADADYQPQESALYSVELATGTLSRLTHSAGPESSPAIIRGGSNVAYVGFEDQKLGYHNQSIWLLDRDTSVVRNMTPSLDRSVTRYELAPDTPSIWFTYDDFGITKLATVDGNGRVEVRHENIGGTTLGRPYNSGAFDIGPRGMYAVTVTDPTRPGDLVVMQDGEQLFKTELNEDVLGHKSIPTAERITATGPGGLEVEGWLVLPPNFDDAAVPMILEIHGGPFANYGPRFSAEVQLYAAAGYAVLYANPRGSTSYGAEFANKIHHNYPSEDYDDLMALVDAALETGNICPDCLFITGGSGGGVLTAWSVGKTDRFAAAVVAKPVINWASFVLTADAYPFFTQYWFSAQPWEDPMQYWNRSPLSLVGNVSTPTMLLTGEVDYRTPMSETEQYYQALKLRKVPTRMVRIPEASHGIAARPSHLIAKIAEVIRWFEEHDPSKG